MAEVKVVNKDTVAVIAAALVAMGMGGCKIKAIRPMERKNWADSARVIALRKI